MSKYKIVSIILCCILTIVESSATPVRKTRNKRNKTYLEIKKYGQSIKKRAATFHAKLKKSLCSKENFLKYFGCLAACSGTGYLFYRQIWPSSPKKSPPTAPTKKVSTTVIFASKQELLALNKVERIKTALRSHYLKDNLGHPFGNLYKFKEWAANDQWHYFHGKVNHIGYDWWMLLTDDIGISNPEGPNAYSVSQKEIDALKSDTSFMDDYREGVRLQLLAWGWDAKNKQPLTSAHPGQVYDVYEIRLQKMAKSLTMFCEKELHDSVKAFFHYHYTNKNRTPKLLNLRKYCTRQLTNPHDGGAAHAVTV